MAHKSLAFTPVLQSTLLLFLSIFPVSFLYLFLHEGGHALVHLILGAEIDVFYVHPFALDGYVRPFLDVENVWNDAAGNGVEILVSLLIFLLIWKRRSLKTLVLVLLFPWGAINSGLGVMNLALNSGDYANIIRLTGMSPVFFYVLDFLLLAFGFFFFISLLPLLGMAPEQRRSLFVLPVSLLLWGLVGVGVAYLTVPGSPIDVRYNLGDSLLGSVVTYPIMGALLGVLLALTYTTLYRRVYQRLPAGLQTETVHLSWKDLGLPGLLAAISIVIGLILIT